MLAVRRLPTKKLFPTKLKPKVNTSSNREAEDNTAMFGCALNRKNVERALNLSMPSRAVLFLKNLLLRLKKELRRRWTRELLPGFLLWICRLRCTTVLTTKLTLLKLLSKLPE